MIVHLWERFLVTQFLSHPNEAFFIKLYQQHTNALFELALQLTGGNRLLAEAVVQNTWIIALEKLPSYSYKSTLRAWLFEITVHCSSEQYRKSRYYMLMNEDSAANSSFFLKRANNQNNTPVEQLSALPVGYRHVLVLHDLYGYEHQKISEILNISEGASKSFLINARKSVSFPVSVINVPDVYLFGKQQHKPYNHSTNADTTIAMPKEMIRKVIRQLKDRDLIRPSFPGFSLRKVTLQFYSMW
ncbi:MAG: polymerase subunit sigma-24 [Bacteroidetes bacterium]|nr:polymerase subunit sigma-24 [Bacteroidota bacterium]